MTKKDIRNAQKLETMLVDESSASLADVLGIIEKLPRLDEGVESLNVTAPVDVLHGYFQGQDELWGISERCFWTLNNKVQALNFKDYFRCIEALPDVKMACSVMRLMVWSLGKEEHKEKLSALFAVFRGISAKFDKVRQVPAAFDKGSIYRDQKRPFSTACAIIYTVRRFGSFFADARQQAFSADFRSALRFLVL